MGEKKSFLSTTTGIITALAALITAVGGGDSSTAPAVDRAEPDRCDRRRVANGDRDARQRRDRAAGGSGGAGLDDHRVCDVGRF